MWHRKEDPLILHRSEVWHGGKFEIVDVEADPEIQRRLGERIREELARK